jgi:dTDP-4-dehydrorhamnose reductase
LLITKFDIIFFCISITSISFCENNLIESRKINVYNTISLIKNFQDKGSFIVYFSSNQVFDGIIDKTGTDIRPNPQSEYGRQKVLVENEIKKLSNIAIIRLTKVVDHNFSLFQFWVYNLKNNRKINPFQDMYMAPIWIDDLSNFLYFFISNPKSGIYHVSAESDISYQDAAIYIANKLKLNLKLIIPISYKEFGINFAPKFTSLNINSENEINFIAYSSYETIDKYLIQNKLVISN